MLGYKARQSRKACGLATLSDRGGSDLCYLAKLLLGVDGSYIGCLLLTTFAVSHNGQRFAAV